MKKLFPLLFVITVLQSCIGAGSNSDIKVTELPEKSLSKIEKTATKEAKKTVEKFFPQLVGNDLNGKNHVLPKAFVGKINLVAVAFAHKQQADVNGWLGTFEELAKKNVAVKFYEIPLISERNALRRTIINNGMRSGIKTPEARAHTITVFTNREKFYALTNTKEDQISVFVLDENGKILWRTDGVANAQNLNNLRQLVAKKLNDKNLNK